MSTYSPVQDTRRKIVIFQPSERANETKLVRKLVTEPAHDSNKIHGVLSAFPEGCIVKWDDGLTSEDFGVHLGKVVEISTHVDEGECGITRDCLAGGRWMEKGGVPEEWEESVGEWMLEAKLALLVTRVGSEETKSVGAIVLRVADLWDEGNSCLDLDKTVLRLSKSKLLDDLGQNWMMVSIVQPLKVDG